MAVIRLPDQIFTGDYGDVVTPVSGDNGKALVWNQTAQRAEWVSVGGSGSPGGSSGQVQYNNAGAFAGHSGFVYDGAGNVTLSAALVSPAWRPASNSTTALQLQNAAGTAIITLDTINGKVGVETTPSAKFDVLSTSPSTVLFRLKAASGQSADLFDIRNASNSQVVRIAYDGTTVFSGGASGNSFIVSGNSLNAFGVSLASGKEIYWGGTADEIYANATTHAFTLKTNGVIRFFVDGSGLLAVGTHAPTAFLHLPASTTSYASLRIPSGTAPTSPNDGDLWFDGTNYKCRIGGVTKTFTVT